MSDIKPLITGTEDTVIFANKMDSDDELEITFLHCGLEHESVDFERYMTEEMVVETIFHMTQVLNNFRKEKAARGDEG